MTIALVYGVRRRGFETILRNKMCTRVTVPTLGSNDLINEYLVLSDWGELKAVEPGAMLTISSLCVPLDMK